MSRINVINANNANAEQQALLEAIQSQLGMVPNFLKVLANSPDALRAFLGLHGIASAGSLDAATRERIALAVAQQNSCDYCVSARSIAAHSGDVTSAELLEVRAAGYSDADIVEIITHVAMNILTNMIGKASLVAIDFPKVDLKLAA